MATSSSSHSGSHKQHHHHHNQEGVVIAPATSTTNSSQNPSVISRRTLQSLAKTVDPHIQMDEETEDMLMSYADDVLEKIIEGACELAVHRKASSVEPQDIQTFMERQHNLWIASDSNDPEPIKGPKKILPAEAHRQRVALIKKNIKKY